MFSHNTTVYFINQHEALPMSILDSVISATVNAPAHPAPVAAIPTPDTKLYNGVETTMFDVVEKPISSDYGIIPNKKGLFVDGDCVNIVSDRYEVHQPREILEQFNQVAERTGLEVNRVLTNPANGGLLVSANYAKTQIAGEPHDVNVTFYTSHCGKYKTFMTLDLLRLSCFNQTPALYREKQRHIVSEKHYRNALNLDTISAKLAGLPQAVERYNEQALQLLDKPLSLTDFVEFFIEHYKIDQTAKRFQSKVDELKAMYYNAPGQSHLGSNAYKAYQAITFNNTHGGRDTLYKNEQVIGKKSDDSLVVLEKLLVA